MSEVMICGRDCHPGDENCNGYCKGEVDNPPEATKEMVLARKKKRAWEAQEAAQKAWYEYFCACDVGSERTTAHEIYQRVRLAPRIG